jgi:hypothetical protein
MVEAAMDPGFPAQRRAGLALPNQTTRRHWPQADAGAVRQQSVRQLVADRSIFVITVTPVLL